MPLAATFTCTAVTASARLHSLERIARAVTVVASLTSA
jgi:hypothetical protein